MWLTIDVGNTNTDFMLWQNDAIIDSIKFSTDKTQKNQYFDDIFAQKKFAWEKVEKSIISSVVPEVNVVLDTFLKQKRVSVVFLSHALVDLDIKYETPENVGADRLAGAYAAATLYPGKNLIIIDFGTAITFDVVSDQKEYVGGIILPGIRTAKQALVQKASLLPDFEIKKAEQLIGHSTQAAMLSGLFHGTVFVVKEFIKAVKKELQATDAIIIATGGDASFFAKEINSIDHIEPYLVHFGLRFIAENF